MKKIITAGFLSASIALGGCASTSGTIATATTNASTTIAAIQQAAVAACSFLPTTATVANLIGTVAGVGTETSVATTLAASICAAVSPKASAKRGGAAPVVNGVTIHGRFVG
ncbi:MAG TPA: hypothetical protein VN828_11045 [Acidobacteriaceae bacterium]|nr:hypothetical protein [Acidobacteriaceae bacterium]